jgi:YegS/Rv2252/BmrU family lipid kinase
MTNALVIGRRRKGRKIASTVREVRRALELQHWTVASRVVTRKAALTRAARRAIKKGCDVVVVVGGDGAILRVAPALADTKAVLGIVPMGTGNLLAGNLGIPKDVPDAVRVVAGGRHRRIDLGHAVVAGKRYDFSVACGIGFDAQVMDKTGAGQKRRWGKLAYLANAATQIGGISNIPLEITLDGESTVTEGAQVFIANFGSMLAGISPRRAVRPDDGFLDVIVVRASGPLHGLLGGWEALRQTALGESSSGRAFRAQARVVRIDTRPRSLVEVDGSVVGQTPVEVSILPSALTVIVPVT